MSTSGNAAKLGATHSNIQTAQSGPSLVGTECISQHETESSLYPLCQPGIGEYGLFIQGKHSLMNNINRIRSNYSYCEYPYLSGKYFNSQEEFL